MSARSSLATIVALLLPALAPAQQPAVADQAPASPAPEGAPPAIVEIEQEGLRQHAFHLASTELQGRYTSTEGQLAAARYVADWFASLGLEPLGDPVDPGDPDGARGWFQAYPVERTAVGEQAVLRFDDRAFPAGFGLLPGRKSEADVAEGRLLWLGYGARDELPETLEADQVPLVILRTRDRKHVPVQAQFMMGLGMFNKASQVARLLARAGAPCVLFGMLHDDSGGGEMLTYCGLLPGKPLLRFGKDAGMAAMVENMRADVPMVFLSRELTLAALAAAGRSIGADGEIVMSEDEGRESVTVRLPIVVDADARATNVVGLLRGADPVLAQEAVVFSSHMDHMGKRVDGAVFHGADDNASGSAAFLEVAQAFAKGERPRRSVIFLSVSGEELGLWGSAWFSREPTWPLADIVANVNIDMIGREAELSGLEEISITPSHRHPRYSSIARGAARLAAAVGLGLTDGDEFYTRSDHYNFAEKGIPVVFFCDGEHEDYHQVTDTADKLEFAKIERVARLAFWVGHEVANADERPQEIGRQPDWLAPLEPEAEAGAAGEAAGRGGEAGHGRRGG